MYIENDIEVEVLPTIGSPLTIKTISQGRTNVINTTIDPLDYRVDYIGVGKGILKKKAPSDNLQNTILTCKTILNHKGASTKQKEIIKSILEKLLNRKEGQIIDTSFVRSVKRSLMHKK